MTVPVQIPVVDSHAAAQQALDGLAALFPLQSQYLAKQYPVSKQTDHPYGIQYGKATVSAAAAAGQQQFTIALPSTWPTAHLCFVATPWPLSSVTGFSPLGSHNQDTSNGKINFVNTTTAQSVEVQWISIGY